MKRVTILILVLLFPVSALAQRLPRTVLPQHYQLRLAPDFQRDKFLGEESIRVSVQQPTLEVILHALEIEFHDVTITAGGKRQKAKVTLVPESQWAVLAVTEPLPIGDAVIEIRYTGILNNELRGFYLGKSNSRKYAASQMEATDARRAFPSFDEPGMKATFDISLTVDKGDTAISNGAVVSDTPGPGPDKHTLRFATTPRMSSYLVALVAGDFKCLEDAVDGIPLRICAAPDKVQLGSFAMEATKHVVRYFNKYFGIKYPFGKLDQIAIPDFRAGAMENAGAVIFRETALLMDDKHATVEQQKRIAGIIAHETAHMWFGDLVTMEWWDDIWLNEGFASWATSKPIEEWKPEWKSGITRVRSAGSTMNTDVLRNTRPIRARAETTDQIDQLFDSIAYGKTAALLRMLESYMGEEPFRKGINTYLSRHAWANSSAHDFTDALATATDKPVDEIMNSFIRQPGFPLVEMSSRCDDEKRIVTIRQKRFFVDREILKNASPQLWKIPVCFRIGRRTECRIMSERAETFPLSGCNEPIVMNPTGLGFYLTSYSSDDRKRVVAVAGQLSSSEKMVLNRDEWYLVRAGGRSIADYLELSGALLDDEEISLVGDAIEQLTSIERYYVPAAKRDAYRRWLGTVVRPKFLKLGWKPRPGESDETRTHRADVLQALGGTVMDPAILKEAGRLALAYLGDRSAIDPSLRSVVLRLAALGGNSALYEKYLATYRSSKDPSERSELLSSLASFRDPELLGRTLNLAISEEVRNQDSGRLLAAVVLNRYGTELGWDFVTSRWADIEKKIPDRMRSTVLGSAVAFCDSENLKEIKAFYAAHPQPAVERAMDLSLERIANCISFKSMQGARLEEWIKDMER
ncbi:MAG TPA: M1 family metallopeptidase [Thermoanaerobaculia bacterium]|nr:M1 family metallopeptidase [Thermoanaerobaculia bacterium]